MKKIIYVFLGLFLGFFINPLFSLNTLAGGYTVDLTVGEIEVSRNNGLTWAAAPVDTVIGESDIVRTGRNSYCMLTMPDNKGSIEILQNTMLVVSQLGMNTRFHVLKGRSLFDIFRPLFSGETLEITTSTAIASVRGTEFYIESDYDYTVLSVNEGTVSYRMNVNIPMEPELAGELENAVEIAVGGGEEAEFTMLEN